MTETAEIHTLPTVRTAAPLTDVFHDAASFEHAQRVAKVFASSNLVPQHLRGNVADCLIAYQIARRLNEEPLTVFQNIYVVSGRPGWKTEYVIARANKAGVFKGRITWKSSGEGEALSVTAQAVLADTGEAISVTADMRMAKAEGWTKNAKYTSMPEHMLRWRSAAMLVRLYAPEVMLGMPVIEEIETAPAEMRDVTPKRSVGEALDAFAEEASSASEETDIQTNPSSAGVAPTAESPAAPEQSAQQSPPAPSAQENTGAAGADTGWPSDKVPTTEQEYAQYARAWIGQVGTSIDAGAAPERWKKDKTLRNRCNVGEDVRDGLKAELDTIVAKLNEEAA